jgi:hypothetical protein
MDKHVMTKFTHCYLPATFGDFAKRYYKELAFCDNEWFEKKLCMLLSVTAHMESECPNEYITESAMRKIPKMGPSRIKILLDNADYFGFTVLKQEAV